MKHPRSQDILTVIRNFEKVLPMAKHEGHLQMQCRNVCDTYLCAAGWYYFSVASVAKKSDNYFNGVNMLESHLGFNVTDYQKNSSSIEVWAQNNEDIWGNKHGYGMFATGRAYRGKGRPNGAQSLQHIVDHWKEVYTRVKALEDAEQVVTTVVADTIVPTPEPIKAHNRIGSAPSELTKIDVGDRIDVMREKLDVIINEVKI